MADDDRLSFEARSPALLEQKKQRARNEGKPIATATPSEDAPDTIAFPGIGTDGNNSGDGSTISFAEYSGPARRDREQQFRNGVKQRKPLRITGDDEPATLESPFVTDDDRVRTENTAIIVGKLRGTEYWAGLIAEAQVVDRLRPAVAIDRAAGLLQNVVSNAADYSAERLDRGISLMLRRIVAQEKYTASSPDDERPGR